MRKLITSAIMLFVVIAMMTGGILAYTHDADMSIRNIITAGQLDLEFKCESSNAHQNPNGELHIPSMIPGYELGCLKYDFKSNEGTNNDSQFQITADYRIIDPPGPESDAQENTPAWLMAQYILITKMDYSSNEALFSVIDCLELLSDWDDDGKLTINDLKLDAEQPEPDLDELPPPAPSDSFSTHLEITLKYDAAADNRFQGDTLLPSIKFSLRQ
jgi:hypothetical protein